MKPSHAQKTVIPITEDNIQACNRSEYIVLVLLGLPCIPLLALLCLDFQRHTFHDIPLLLIIFSMLLLIFLWSRKKQQSRKQEMWCVGPTGLISRTAGIERVIAWGALQSAEITSAGVRIRYKESVRPGAPPRPRMFTLYLSEPGVESFMESVAKFRRIRRPQPVAARPKRSFSLFLPEISMTIVVAMIIGWAAYNGIMQFRSFNWPDVTGTITLSECDESKLNKGAYWALTYEYVVNGHKYQSTQFRLWGERLVGEPQEIKSYALAHPAGAAITVFFDPGHPEISVIKRGPAWAVIGTIVTGGIGYVLVFWHFRLLRPKDREIIIYSD